ncbi:hypothetical protein KI387_024621, partial [Taxus chinensis]
LSDILEGTMDNESVINALYGGLNEDQYVFPAIYWSIAEKASIVGRAAQILSRTK